MCMCMWVSVCCGGVLSNCFIFHFYLVGFLLLFSVYYFFMFTFGRFEREKYREREYENMVLVETGREKILGKTGEKKR